MGKNTLLGAIDYVNVAPVQTYGPVYSDIAQSPNPTDTYANVVTLPTDYPLVSPVKFLPGGPAGGGGEMTFEKIETAPVPMPPAVTREDRQTTTTEGEGEGPKPMSKKNMVLFGIGALVLGYLILRKK